MLSRDFCFWLQGFFEIQDVESSGYVITNAQVRVIKQHLALVFKHEIDTAMGNEEHQQELNEIHNSKPPLVHHYHNVPAYLKNIPRLPEEGLMRC